MSSPEHTYGPSGDCHGRFWPHVRRIEEESPAARVLPCMRKAGRLLAQHTSGNVLDAAIRSFKGYLAPDSATTDAGTSLSGVASDVPVMNAPTNNTEWAELIVKEILSASDMNDARNRAFRILEMFDKSAANCSIRYEAQKMRERCLQQTSQDLGRIGHSQYSMYYNDYGSLVLLEEER
ncbi:hypothetical protein ZWY2020_058097 [Hordeum vulgare]|nr:hypothetical protein ZWY2020_058097 [Hordeum vulgare]